jgi:hypothetical protein
MRSNLVCLPALSVHSYFTASHCPSRKATLWRNSAHRVLLEDQGNACYCDRDIRESGTKSYGGNASQLEVRSRFNIHILLTTSQLLSLTLPKSISAGLGHVLCNTKSLLRTCSQANVCLYICWMSCQHYTHTFMNTYYLYLMDGQIHDLHGACSSYQALHIFSERLHTMFHSSATYKCPTQTRK